MSIKCVTFKDIRGVHIESTVHIGHKYLIHLLIYMTIFQMLQFFDILKFRVCESWGGGSSLKPAFTRSVIYYLMIARQKNHFLLKICYLSFKAAKSMLNLFFQSHILTLCGSKISPILYKMCLCTDKSHFFFSSTISVLGDSLYVYFRF